jgi:hypothetical protein
LHGQCLEGLPPSPKKVIEFNLEKHVAGRYRIRPIHQFCKNQAE